MNRKTIKILVFTCVCIAPFVLFFIGSLTDIPMLATIGLILLFGSGAIFAIVMCAILLRNRRRVEKSDENENKPIRRAKTGAWHKSSPVSGWKTLLRIACVLLVLSIVSSTVLVFFKQYLIVGITCGIAAVSLVLIIIVFTSKMYVSLTGVGIRKNAPVYQGTVLQCSVSGNNLLHFGKRRKIYDENIIYKIKFELDGLEKTTYSTVFYNEGTTIFVRGEKYGKRFIVADGDLQ